MSGGFVGKPIRTAGVAYTGTAGTSSAIGGQTNLVRIVCTSNAHVAFDATATTSDMYMTAGREEYFYARPGCTISAIQDSAGGTMYITEMSR